MQIIMQQEEPVKNKVEKENENHLQNHVILANILPSPIISKPIINISESENDSYQNQIIDNKKRTGQVDVASLPTEYISDDYLRGLEPLYDDWSSNSDFLGGKRGGITQQMVGDGIPRYDYESIVIGYEQQDLQIKEQVEILNKELEGIVIVAGTQKLDEEQNKETIKIFDQINHDMLYSDRLVELGADKDMVQQHLEIVYEHLRICAKDVQYRGHELVQELEGVGEEIFAREPDRIMAREFVDSYLIATEWFEHKAQEMVKNDLPKIQDAGMELAKALNETEQTMIELEEKDAPTEEILVRAREDIEHMVDICYAVMCDGGENEDSLSFEVVGEDRV
jgi:hypothetical protein